MDFTKVGSFAVCCICIIASSMNHLKGDSKNSPLMNIEFENSRKDEMVNIKWKRRIVQKIDFLNLFEI